VRSIRIIITVRNKSLEESNQLMDRVSVKARSRIMSLVRSRHGRTTEKRLRAHLVRRGIAGWKMCDDTLPGKPDFVFRKRRLVIFVDGCFWHGCTECKRPPKSNVNFWLDKFSSNLERDKRTSFALSELGWKVLRIKECTLKSEARTRTFLDELEIQIDGQSVPDSTS